MINKEKLKELTKQYWDEGWEVKKYIEQLLPKEMDHLKQCNRIPTGTTETLVQLVGFSWEPLLISVCAYKPQKIFLILNRWYNEQEGSARGDTFKEYVSKLKEQGLIDNIPEVLPTPWETVEDAPEGIFKFLKKYILPPLNEGKRIVIDITGAKKSMVSGAYLFSSYTNCPVSYVDYDEYSEKHGKPYGYTCKIKELNNPMELFKLREWGRVEQLYEQYAFRGAMEIINEIKEGAKSFLEEEDHKRIDLLIECLEFYGTWDEGDYRGAWNKYQQLKERIRGITCLTAVEKLGDIWPDKNNLKKDIKSIEGLENIEDSIYLKDVELLTYAYDELEKIKRLTRYSEDYRSALLRAAGLSDFLLKSRVIRLWFNNQFIIEMNNNKYTREDIENQQIDMLLEIDKELLEYSGATRLIKSLRWSCSKGDYVLILDGLEESTRAEGHKSDDAPELDKFWNCVDSAGLNLPDDIFILRNKAIHFCLSVPKEIAEAAIKLAEENLKDFKQKWIINGKYEAMSWHDLCDACGIKFLPKLRRDINE